MREHLVLLAVDLRPFDSQMELVKVRRGRKTSPLFSVGEESEEVVPVVLSIVTVGVEAAGVRVGGARMVWDKSLGRLEGSEWELDLGFRPLDSKAKKLTWFRIRASVKEIE